MPVYGLQNLLFKHLQVVLISKHFVICTTIFFKISMNGQVKYELLMIEKAESVLRGISIEYLDCFDIEKDVIAVLKDMNDYSWKTAEFNVAARAFADFLTRLWKIHPYREGNTRTIVTFCSQFIESKGFYIDSNLFKDNV